jgi:outer membrane protein assembly factor BamB
MRNTLRRSFFALTLFAAASIAAQEPGALVWQASPGPRDLDTLVESSGVLVAGNINSLGGVYAFNAQTGKLLWKSTGDMATGPMAADGSRLFVILSHNKPHLIAFDLKTGKRLWSVEGEGKFGSGGVAYEDGRIFVMSRDGFVKAYAAATGASLWQFDWGSEDPMCPTELTVANSRLYFGGGSFERGNHGGKYLWAVNAANGQLAWKLATRIDPKSSSNCITPPTVDGKVLAYTSENYLFGVDISTGLTLWKQSVTVMSGGYPKPQILSPAIAGDGSIFVATNDTLLRYTTTGQQLHSWPFQLSSSNPERHVFAIDNGIFYFVGQFPEDNSMPGKYPLHAMDIRSGKILWRHRVNRDGPMSNWGTDMVLPAESGVYYNNAKLVAKAAR